MNTKVISVINNFDVFEHVIKNNSNLKECEIVFYDNTNENVSITKRYNDFIETRVLNNEEDFWCVFIHQDFGFLENLSQKVRFMDKKIIYGAVGVKLFKNAALKKLGIADKIMVKGKGELKVPFGKIKQGNNDYNFRDYGHEVFTQIEVDAIDCCCIMIHSSLIRKFGLKFDDNLNFHLYAEDFCYRAKNEFKVKVRVIQTNCFHMGAGVLDDSYLEALKYLREKLNTNRIPSTTPTQAFD